MSATAPVPTPRTLLTFVALAALLVVGALYAVAAIAPPDVTLGIVQKIFYFHVGSAFAMLLCLTGGSAASLVDLVQPSDRVDALARSLIDTGILFALMVLTSGPLWARKSWGAWWTWEPRLTLTLLVLLLAVGVLAVRAMAPYAATGRRIGAAVATLAAPTSYLIHVAVQKWGGTHPQVIQGGGIQNAEMRIAFWTSVAALLVFAGVLAAVRYRVLRLEQAVHALRLERSAEALRQSRAEAVPAASGA